MNNFFLVSLNRTFLPSAPTKDRIFRCTPDIYSDIQSNKRDLARDHSPIHYFIEKSCSLVTYFNIISDKLFYASIFRSNTKNTINVILHYNGTYPEYQKINLNNTEDALCAINGSWATWLSNSLQKIYTMICNPEIPKNPCINNYNPLVSNKTILIFKPLE